MFLPRLPTCKSMAISRVSDSGKKAVNVSTWFLWRYLRVSVSRQACN